MSKKYIVLRKEYNYNDEISYCNNDAGVGKPISIFDIYEDARQYRLKEEKKALSDLNLAGYCYGWKDIFPIVDIQEANRVLGTNWREDEQFYEGWKIPENLTDHQLNWLLNNLTINFYEIVEL